MNRRLGVRLRIEVVQDVQVTPADIEAALPNGFHDAVLRELHVEFARKDLRLVFDFLVGDPEAETDEGREAMRPGLVRLGGVTSMRVGTPDPRYGFTAAGGVLVDGGFGVYPGEPLPPDDALVRLWLFVSTWNARMTFTARECALEWA